MPATAYNVSWRQRWWWWLTSYRNSLLTVGVLRLGRVIWSVAGAGEAIRHGVITIRRRSRARRCSPVSSTWSCHFERRYLGSFTSCCCVVIAIPDDAIWPRKRWHWRAVLQSVCCDETAWMLGSWTGASFSAVCNVLGYSVLNELLLPLVGVWLFLSLASTSVFSRIWTAWRS